MKNSAFDGLVEAAVANVRDLIAECIMQDRVTITTLAEQLGLSYSGLRKMLGRHAGTTTATGTTDVGIGDVAVILSLLGRDFQFRAVPVELRNQEDNEGWRTISRALDSEGVGT